MKTGGAMTDLLLTVLVVLYVVILAVAIQRSTRD